MVATTVDWYDQEGQLIVSKDADGFFTCNIYDPATGLLTETIQDANTADKSEFDWSDLPVDQATGLPIDPTTTPSQPIVMASGGGKNVVTDYSYDNEHRLDQILGPIHTADVDGVAASVRTASWTYYDDADNATVSAQGYITQDTSGDWTVFTVVNPVTVTINNPDGQVTNQFQAAVDMVEGTVVWVANTTTNDDVVVVPSGQTALGILGGLGLPNQSSYDAWTTYQYSHKQLVSTRVYYAIPNSGTGTAATNYDETDYGYNAVGRQEWTETPDGTITWNVLNAHGLTVSTWQGTNDGGAAAFQSYLSTNPNATTGPNGTEIFRVTDDQYDSDGDLTVTTKYDGSGDSYTTYNQYDWRDRQVGTLGPDGVASITTYDNLGKDLEDQTYANASYNGSTEQISYEPDELRAQTVTEYDTEGQMYESRVYEVQQEIEPDPGTVGDYLATESWYDANGNLVATQTGDGAFQKYAYDGLGDEVESYTCYGLGTDYASATTVGADDAVVQQTQTWYDAAGEAVAAVTFGGLPGYMGTGPLTAANSYESGSASYYDGIGRDIENVNYGHEQPSDSTHYFFDGNSNLLANPDGIPTVAESNPPAPNSPSNPNATTDYIVSQTVYNAPTPTGQAIDTIDNAGHVSRTIYDPAGRTVRTIKNYTGPSGFDSSGVPLYTDTAQDVTTDYQYDSAGRLVTMIAYDPDGATQPVQQQATKYLYQSSVDGSWQTEIVCPDSTDQVTQDPTTGDWTITSGTDHTSTTYDWLGRETTSTDERGVTHAYSYDSAGRLTADTITSFGNPDQNVDQTVSEIVTAYDDLGRGKIRQQRGVGGWQRDRAQPSPRSL